MRYVILVLGLMCGVCGVAFASADAHHVMDVSKTDIIPRTINFVIFVALMWYLVADKLKAMLRDRSRGIADRLSQTQTKVQDSRAKKEKAQQRLKDVHEQVNEMIKIAKQEAEISAQKIEEKTKEQVQNLIKSNEEAMEFQERLFQKQIVEEILNEAFSSPTLKIESSDYVGILEKKVA